ncbi:MAG: glycosyltransferase family 39 protein, partial [Chitinophagales bacterium]|nr:glycosyltransferase family 39 protein [Chitinophagales bacterium]
MSLNAASKYRKFLLFGLLFTLSAVLHFPYFNKDIISAHVWRQSQTMTNIVNFYEEDFNILNPRKNDRGDGSGIMRMEFPLYQWLCAALWKIFGKHIWIVRLFTFIIGLCSVVAIYFLNKIFWNRQSAAIGAAFCFSFSPAFFYYTICPLPDNLALCFGLWSLYFFYLYFDKVLYKYLFIGAIFGALSALCKLPFVLYFIVPFF